MVLGCMAWRELLLREIVLSIQRRMPYLSSWNAGPRPGAGAQKVVVLGMMELRLRRFVVLQVARAPPGIVLLPAIGLHRRGHAERVADTLPGAALETVTSEVLRWRWAGRKHTKFECGVRRASVVGLVERVQ